MASMRLTPEEDVDRYKQFLRLKTTHPNPDLASCVEWLTVQAKEMGMSIRTVEYAKGLPIVLMTRVGTDPSLPSIVLNCHMDVVPTVDEKWDKLPSGETPFSAYEDSDGKIYARGSQDMKCVGAQYLSALRRLEGQEFKRTIHCCWVPDEEIGGPQGMKIFAQSAEFQELNIGVALDEGLAHPEDKFVVYYGERTPLWARFKAQGPVGHGSKLIPNTAIDRLLAAVRKLQDMRQVAVETLEKDESKTLGDVTTINITVLQGGTSSDGGKTFAPNVIPSDAAITADIRVSPTQWKETIAELDRLAKEHNLELDYPNLLGGQPSQFPINSATGMRWYDTIEDVLGKYTKVEKTIFPAATDSRFIRMAGVPAFGFSPMRKTPSLLHDHNEFLERSTFLEGVTVYTELIPRLANAVMAQGNKL